MSLRTRVALVTAAVTAVVVLVAGAMLVAFVRRDREEALDRQLAEQAATIARRASALLFPQRPRIVDRIPVERLSPNVHLVGRILSDETVVVVIGDFPLSKDEPAPGGYSTVDDGDTTWRVLSLPAERIVADPARVRQFAELLGQSEREGRLVVEVALPTDQVEETVREVTGRIVFLGSLGLVASALGGWVLGGAALRPLSRLRHEADRVRDTSDLDTRVEDRHGLKEVDQLAATLNAMLDRLSEASRQREEALEAARAFAAHAAHELRTPLTSIQANLEVLANPALTPEQREEVVFELREQQSRLTRLLDVLRLLSRGDLTGELPDEEIVLEELVSSVCRHARRRHPDADIELVVRTPSISTRGWYEGLHAALDNLLENAIVHGRDERGRAFARVILEAADGDVLLAVEDHGRGVPPDERTKIFERFERGSDTRSAGSGLGLALVRQQAVLHGGDVTVTDAEPRGARFEIRLPRA